MDSQHFKQQLRTCAVVALTALATMTATVTAKAQAQKADTTVYSSVETLPQFPGGIQAFMTYVKTNLRYPAEAQKQKVEGRVNVMFVVEPNGQLSNVKAVGRPMPLLQDEAIRVMKASPVWAAGKQGGRPVRVQYTVPIVFNLKG